LQIHSKGRKRRKILGGSGARSRFEDAGDKNNVGGGEFRWLRARGGSGDGGGREKNWPREALGRGLYAPAAGSPDALKVAPDASGDHRTHA